MDQLSLQFDRQSVEIAEGAKGLAYMLISLWESAPWWQLVYPDTDHFADNVVNWVWLPKDDSSLFVAGTALGRAVLPPDWSVMTARIDFTEPRSAPFLIEWDRCIPGGGAAPICGSLPWHRQQ